MSRAHSYSHSRAHSKTFPSLHLRHSSFSNPSVALPTSQLILQPFRSYVTAHSPTLLSLCSFSNLSVTSPTSQLILQPFRRFTYVTAHSLTLPLLHLCHSSFSNPSFVSPTSQALHIRHLASRPWLQEYLRYFTFTLFEIDYWKQNKFIYFYFNLLLFVGLTIQSHSWKGFFFFIWITWRDSYWMWSLCR